jgi:hypothetical protein
MPSEKSGRILLFFICMMISAAITRQALHLQDCCQINPSEGRFAQKNARFYRKYP